MSKVLHATKIVESNPNATSKELISQFINDLGMSKAMARTYLYNIRQKAKQPAKVKVTKEKAVKATKPVKSDVTVDRSSQAA